MIMSVEIIIVKQRFFFFLQYFEKYKISHWNDINIYFKFSTIHSLNSFFLRTNFLVGKKFQIVHIEADYLPVNI